MRLIVRVCAIAAFAGLGGCHLHLLADEACLDRQPYDGAVSAPPLRAAEGLPPANTKNSLKIPEVTGTVKPRKEGESCLDRSPSFFADRPKPPVPK
jgi:uncharacterized lipoprotein